MSSKSPRTHSRQSVDELKTRLWMNIGKNTNCCNFRSSQIQSFRLYNISQGMLVNNGEHNAERRNYVAEVLVRVPKATRRFIRASPLSWKETKGKFQCSACTRWNHVSLASLTTLLLQNLLPRSAVPHATIYLYFYRAAHFMRAHPRTRIETEGERELSTAQSLRVVTSTSNALVYRYTGCSYYRHSTFPFYIT